MTRIPPTDYYDSPLLTEVRNGGIKRGIEWMREKVLETILKYPDFSGKAAYYAELVNRINSDEYFVKTNETTKGR